MNKIDQLFIRACKTNDPITRLRSIRKRFFLVGKVNDDMHIIHRLADICDKYAPMKISDVITKMSDSYYWYEKVKPDAEQRCLNMLMSRIAFTKVSELNGLTAPAIFRNNKESKK